MLRDLFLLVIVVVSGSAPFVAPVSREAPVSMITGPMLAVRADLEKSAIILRETHGEVNTILDDISGAALAGQR